MTIDVIHRLDDVRHKIRTLERIWGLKLSPQMMMLEQIVEKINTLERLDGRRYETKGTE